MEYVPALEYVWVRLSAVVLLKVPSPKNHVWLVIAPDDRSVKVTVNDLDPAVGSATKSATGSVPAAPSRTLVLLPPSLVTSTALLKFPEFAGANLSTRLVEPNPGS